MSKLLSWAGVTALMSVFACAAPVANTESTARTGNSPAQVVAEEEPMDCHYETPTGSHLQYKVCRTVEQKQDDRAASERLLRRPARNPVDPASN